jgi:chromate transporter
MVVVLAVLYIRFGDQGVIQGLFRGIGPAVIAIIALGTYKLSKKNLEKRPMLWGIAIINTVATAITGAEHLFLILAGGVLLPALLYFSKPRPTPTLLLIAPASLTAGLFGPAPPETLWQILLFFAKAGAFVFGSGLAIVPFLHGGVVNEFKWLTERQFLDAVAVAMITPGPVVITVGFIGYLVAGFSGACMAAIGTFLPCYLFTVLPAPYFNRFASNPYVEEFSSGVTAAAIGAIGGAVIVLARQTLTDFLTMGICAASLFLLLKLKKLTEPKLIFLAALVGIGLSLFS